MLNDYKQHDEYQFLLDIPASEYHADPCDQPSISSSLAHTIITESPYIAYLNHPKLCPQIEGEEAEDEGSTAMNAGTAIHTMLLGGESRIEVLPFADYRTKAARLAKADCVARGKVPIKEAEFDRLALVSGMIQTKMAAHGCRMDGAREHVAVVDHGAGLLSRHMLDHFELRDGEACIDDLKTTYDANPKRMQRAIYNMGYDIQAAAYIEAIEKLWPEFAGRVKFTFWFCTIKSPIMVVPTNLSPTYLLLGKKRWQRAKEIFADCLAKNSWPSYDEMPVTIEPTKWQVNEEFDATGPVDKPIEAYF